jgi:hypothetical protein
MDAAIRTLRVPRGVPGVAAFAGVALVGAVAIAWISTSHPAGLRALLAFGLVLNIVILGLRWPRLATFAALLYLPLMALLRRLLIHEAGWTSFDPLLLVGPMAAAFLLYRTVLWPRTRLPWDLTYRLVLALLVIATLHAFSPLNPSFTAGVTGLLFVAPPLMWFLVGREVADRGLIRVLLLALIPIAALIGAYGWIQSRGDVPSWDDDWLRIAGYAALSVEDKLRAFGTLSSSLEYAQLLGIAGISAVAFALHRRPWLLLGVPVLAAPLWLSGVRGGVLYAVIALIVVLALRMAVRARHPAATAGILSVLGMVAVIGGMVVAKPALISAANSTGNALIIRQVEGLTDPLNKEKSTGGEHLTLLTQGIGSGFTNPVGSGTGSINASAQKFGGEGADAGTEVDISEAFVGFGAMGGLIYLVIVITTLRTAFRRYFATRDPVALAIAGLLIVTIGQWLNGGLYAVASITWFLIGWVTQPQRESATLEPSENEPQPAAIPPAPAYAAR